jgi:uncharacterized membrane protein
MLAARKNKEMKEMNQKSIFYVILAILATGVMAFCIHRNS